MTVNWPVHEGVLELGDLPAERGGVIRGARLSWQSHGTLNAAGDNVIVWPSGRLQRDGIVVAGERHDAFPAAEGRVPRAVECPVGDAAGKGPQTG